MDLGVAHHMGMDTGVNPRANPDMLKLEINESQAVIRELVEAVLISSSFMCRHLVANNQGSLLLSIRHVRSFLS